MSILQQFPLLIIISGPSGVGKDSVVQTLKARLPAVHVVVTATNRPPRPNETHGVDYFFVSTEEFVRMIEQDELVEYAQVYNDYKGVPKEQLRAAFASGQDVVMRVDVQGAATLHAKHPDALLIYLYAEDDELFRRLQARGTDTDANLRLRVAMARRELAQLPEFDYVVENADARLDETVATIIHIIEAEHHRVKPRRVSL
jgi:guanylate kinase